MTSAIFLDRDGTIIKDNGHIGDIKQVEFYPYTFECLRNLQDKYSLFIITNQPGIAKGIIKKQQVENVNSYIYEILIAEGIKINEIYYCPHQQNDNCKCRKPKTYFLIKAQKKYSLNLKKSFVIGDHPSDVQLAINSGATGIYILKGHGKKHYSELSQLSTKIIVKQNLKSATKFITDI